MERKAMNESRIVAHQLGRTPRGAYVVSVRCSYGYPQVIRVHPVVVGKPFPTLYWLTCPFLAREIGHLEAEGWVKQLEHRMQEQPELRAAMHQAHRRTCELRDQLLTPEERAALTTDRTLVGLSGRGIGGISDWDRLKCLHLHVAHALSGNNPIGDLVLGMISSPECSPQQVICSAYE